MENLIHENGHRLFLSESFSTKNKPKTESNRFVGTDHAETTINEHNKIRFGKIKWKKGGKVGFLVPE